MDVSESFAIPVTFFIGKVILQCISYAFIVGRGCCNKQEDVPEGVRLSGSDCKKNVVAVDCIINGNAE